MLCNCIEQMLASKNYVLVYGDYRCLVMLFADIRDRGGETYLIFTGTNKAIVVAERDVTSSVLEQRTDDFDLVDMRYKDRKVGCEFITYKIVQNEKDVLGKVLYSIFGTACYT